MDPISQGALGAAAALAAFGSRAAGSRAAFGNLGDRAAVEDEGLPLRVVAALGALSGMAADLDVLIRSSSDPLLAIEYHRHFTHSIAFMPLGAAVAFLPWLLRQDVRNHWKLALSISLLGYATHAPLDCFTTYGTQLFWPFSSHRVAWSFVSVVDPLFTLPLLAFLTLSLLRRNVNWARGGLLLSLGYLGLGGWQHSRASNTQQSMIAARGHDAERRAVFTTFMNQVTWRSLYERAGRIYVDQIRVPFLGPVCITEGTSIAMAQPLAPPPGPEVARGERLMRWFSGNWVAYIGDDPKMLGDLRYSLLPYGTRPFWAVLLDRKNDRTDWISTREERKIGVTDVVRLIFQTPEGSTCLP